MPVSWSGDPNQSWGVVALEVVAVGADLEGVPTVRSFLHYIWRVLQIPRRRPEEGRSRVLSRRKTSFNYLIVSLFSLLSFCVGFDFV